MLKVLAPKRLKYIGALCKEIRLNSIKIGTRPMSVRCGKTKSQILDFELGKRDDIMLEGLISILINYGLYLVVVDSKTLKNIEGIQNEDT